MVVIKILLLNVVLLLNCMLICWFCYVFVFSNYINWMLNVLISRSMFSNKIL